MMDARIIGMSAALGSAASWAMGSILFKKLGEKLSPMALTLAKGTLSALLLGVTLLLSSYADIAPTPLLLLIFSGVLGIAVGDSFFFAALENLSPHSLVVLSTLGEILTIIWAVLVLRERPTLTAWGGIGLVIVGIVTVLYPQVTSSDSDINSSEKPQQNSVFKGVIFGLISVLCMSASIIVAKIGLESVSALTATFVRMLAGTTGMFFLGLTTKKIGVWMSPFQSDPQLIKQLIYSVLFITFGGFWLSLVGLKYVDVAIAQTLNSTDPLFALIFSAILLQEKVTMSAFIGTIFTISGIVLICNG
ncbi:MAG: DMT family transporter [Xenococcaceae cyanobacterium]